jgi:hypothetical protein
MLPPSAQRVPLHTSHYANARIRRRTEMNIAYYRGRRHLIPERLRQLDQEWDVERALELASATLSLTGLLAHLTTGRRRWLALPLVVQSFFLQHALEGWCPPLPVLRALGFRTAREIEDERHALTSAGPRREYAPPAGSAQPGPAAAAGIQTD